MLRCCCLRRALHTRLTDSQPQGSSLLDTLSKCAHCKYAPQLRHSTRLPAHSQVDWPALYAGCDLARANERRCDELLQQGSSQQAALQVADEYAQSFSTQVGQLPLPAGCAALQIDDTHVGVWPALGHAHSRVAGASHGHFCVCACSTAPSCTLQPSRPLLIC